MKRNFRTHYDNLHIDQTAGDDDIRKAYRRLSKQYHPDYNDDPKAIKIMQMINRAYEVLSDPDQRLEHDLWISQKLAEQKTRMIPTVYSEIPQASDSTDSGYGRTMIHLIGAAMLVAVTALITMWLLRHKLGTNDGFVEQPPPVLLVATAPNGAQWPSKSTLVGGYPELMQTGTLHFLIENSHAYAPYFVQLYLRDQAGQAIRTAYIAPRSDVKLDRLPDGQYFVRYMDLTSTQWNQSAEVLLNRDASLRLD